MLFLVTRNSGVFFHQTWDRDNTKTVKSTIYLLNFASNSLVAGEARGKHSSHFLEKENEWKKEKDIVPVGLTDCFISIFMPDHVMAFPAI